jgi:predicted NAD/FAD-binding protein
MNNLQKLETDHPIFVTLNTDRRPAESMIYNEHVFKHPVFTKKTYDAQRKIGDIQGKNNYWFCGAYQRYGFHEDGLLSSYNLVKSMGNDLSWF